MKIQSINQSNSSYPRFAENKSNNKQRSFTGLVKLTDISGETVVMDAKRIIGVFDHPIQLDFHCNPQKHYTEEVYGGKDGDQFQHAVFKGINIAYESLFPQAFIDKLPKASKDFLSSRLVHCSATVEEFTEFWEKALNSKKAMSFGEWTENSFLKRVKEVGKYKNFGDFFDTPYEEEMKSMPGFIECFEQDSRWWR